MRSLVLLLASLVLSGCMTVSDMAEGTRYQMSDAGLLDHSDTRRTASVRIQPDSFVFIAQGSFVPPGSAYPRPNVVAEEAFNGFVEYFPMVRITCCTAASPRRMTVSATPMNGRTKRPWTVSAWTTALSRSC